MCSHKSKTELCTATGHDSVSAWHRACPFARRSVVSAPPPIAGASANSGLLFGFMRENKRPSDSASRTCTMLALPASAPIALRPWLLCLRFTCNPAGCEIAAGANVLLIKTKPYAGSVENASIVPESEHCLSEASLRRLGLIGGAAFSPKTASRFCSYENTLPRRTISQKQICA